MLVSAAGIERAEVPGTGMGQSLKEGTALFLGKDRPMCSSRAVHCHTSADDSSDNPLLHGHTHTKHTLEKLLEINFETLEKWQ